jgi:hypothetical protein
MRISRSLISVAFFCEHCHKEKSFVPINFACELTGVSRSTIYYWMERAWIHWLEFPSGRRVICQESLRLRAPESTPTALPPSKNPLKTVRNCPKVSIA